VGDREGADISFDAHDIRVSVSWKAQVFADAEEARIVDEYLDDIAFERVVSAWRADLAERGIELPVADDPLRDPTFIAKVTSGYTGYLD
jgi:hypothetical protein